MATMSLGFCDVFSALRAVGAAAHAERLIAQRETSITRIGLLVILRSALSQRHPHPTYSDSLCVSINPEHRRERVQGRLRELDGSAHGGTSTEAEEYSHGQLYG